MRRFFITALLVAMPLVAAAEPSLTVSTSSDAGDLPLDGQGTASTHVVKIAAITLSTASSNGLTVFITSGT